MILKRRDALYASRRFWCYKLGMPLMVLFWLRSWRSCEYDTDRHAAQLGQGPLLQEFLELYAQPFDLAIPYFQGMTHPYTELRIDKLELQEQAV